MKVQLVAEEGTHRAWYHVAGANLTLLNAVRRALIADLPTFAIGEVHFYENTSALFNEYLANRLGLIPLTFEESSAASEVSFSLDAEALDEEKTVYSGDLVSQDEAIKAALVHIPIMKLGKGQRLRLEATATVGTGKLNAKFQSALGSYGYVHEFKLTDKCKKCAKAIKPHEPALVGKLPASAIPEHSLLCDECTSKITTAPATDAVLFVVESFNNLPARQQMFRAIQAVEGHFKSVSEFVKSA